MKKPIELLAPAKNTSVMRAAFQAGADAVYMGLTRFSARAYADNEPAEDFVSAIDEAHLRGKKLYLTLNTLLKERELESEIEPLLKPLYEAGLDAVIVQDLGLMALINRSFPDLPIHASTQTALTGPESALFLKDLNVKRVVLPRELSLKEIEAFVNETGMEAEVFIHGALCYCYSGQCLFSSLAGGRSGNRGRCAQPCRLPYTFSDSQGKTLSKPDKPFLLSLKDLNTIDFLPDLIRAGATSFKIEGRMKKASYASGVTAVYRKYIDRALSDEPYRVEKEDRELLFTLFNRQGFTDGYLTKRNGADMIASSEKALRIPDEAELERITKSYLDRTFEVPVKGVYRIAEGEPYRMTLTASVGGQEVSCTVTGDGIAEKAERSEAKKSDVEKQFIKTGGSGFTFESLSGELDEGLFLPVKALNEFRRKSLTELKEAILKPYRRYAS